MHEVIAIPWLIVFIYSWIIFILFVDKSRLNKTVYGGIIAFMLGSVVDWAGHQLQLYSFQDNLINWAGNSIFYTTGPLFTMGTLFFQYLSLNRKAQAGNIAAFTAAYFAVELLLVRAGAASYLHWHYLASLAVDILVFTTFSYVGEIIVYGREKTKNSR